MSKVRDTLFELLENGGLDAHTMAEMLIKWMAEDSLLECLRQITRRINQDRTVSDTWLEMVWPAGTDM